jgi:hypothetical protein
MLPRYSALGWSQDWLPPYIATEPPGSSAPLLVWMSKMPVVRRPNSAGSAPVSSVIELASRGLSPPPAPKRVAPSGSTMPLSRYWMLPICSRTWMLPALEESWLTPGACRSTRESELFSPPGWASIARLVSS